MTNFDDEYIFSFRMYTTLTLKLMFILNHKPKKLETLVTFV